MSIPATRSDFKAYNLRALGDGVLQINVSDAQVEDRIDEALYMYQQFHMDATMKTWMKHKVTASKLWFQAGSQSNTFMTGEVITGNTSGATAVIDDANGASLFVMFHNGGSDLHVTPDANTYSDSAYLPGFLTGETVTGSRTGTTAVVANTIFPTVTVANTTGYLVTETVTETINAVIVVTATVNAIVNSTTLILSSVTGTVTLGSNLVGGTSATSQTITDSNSAVTFIEMGDIDNRWIPIPEAVISVTRVIPVYDSRIGADILFDPQSQFNMSLLSNFTSNSIVPYYIGRSYQQLLNDTFRGRPAIRFQRHMNRLYIDVNWIQTCGVGQYWLIEGARVIDPDQFTDIYGDRWLQKYTQSLIKRQWAMNMGKFAGIALPGGVTLNARDMLNDANEEIEKLEKSLKDEFELPVDFMVG
jgi:hypothetical protein